MPVQDYSFTVMRAGLSLRELCVPRTLGTRRRIFWTPRCTVCVLLQGTGARNRYTSLPELCRNECEGARSRLEESVQTKPGSADSDESLSGP